ncbi:MAG TPA: PEP-CTERM sorting domain-containing protein, partial [Roseiarcus sp.]|nr:PEP-CTERM sorting domain-containing protein [Roseiarcus sp.]
VHGAEALISPPSYLFKLCNGRNCEDVLQTTTADSDNKWMSALGMDLTAGYYTVGIIDLSLAGDPEFFFRFESPLSQIASVPEPSTWAMMALGFAGLGYLACRRASQTRTA